MKRGTRILVALLVALVCLTPAWPATAVPPDDGWVTGITEIFRDWLRFDRWPMDPRGREDVRPPEPTPSGGNGSVPTYGDSSTQPDQDPPAGESYPTGDPNG